VGQFYVLVDNRLETNAGENAIRPSKLGATT